VAHPPAARDRAVAGQSATRIAGLSGV